MNDRYKKIDEKSKIITDLLGCKIDEGIRELIVLLNYNNIGTTQSCWGHKNWGEKFPWFDIKNEYHNNIENIISTEISNVISNTTSSSQVIKIKARNLECTNLNITQDAIIEQVSSNIANTIVSNTLKNVASNEDVQKLSQKSDQLNAGLSLFGGIFILIIIGGFVLFAKKIMQYILPIIIIGLGIYIYYVSKTNQPITMYVLIALEIILFGIWLYCLFSKSPVDQIGSQLEKQMDSLAKSAEDLSKKEVKLEIK